MNKKEQPTTRCGELQESLLFQKLSLIGLANYFGNSDDSSGH